MWSIHLFLQELQIITMSDPIDSDTIINNDISDKNKNVIREKSLFNEKTHTDNDVAEWSIVHFETDEEEDIEGFDDLIASSWITTTGIVLVSHERTSSNNTKISKTVCKS